MNIKDSYLHGGTHVVKDIQFSNPADGTNAGRLVATITWAQEGSTDTVIPITIGLSSFGPQIKNTVLAAPSSQNDVPSFRYLVAADIPSLNASKITDGEFDAARLPLATDSAKGAVILGVAQDSTTDISGKQYWVKMNGNGKIYVDVPWENNTHYTAVPILGASTDKVNATTTNNATFLNIIENSAKSGGVQITGAGGTTVSAINGKLTITSTTYKLKLNNSDKGTTGGTDLGTFYAPTSTGTGFLKGTAGDNGAITWSWDNSTYLTSHYTAVPVLGGSGATANATSDTTNPYLGIVENSTQSGQIQISGSGGTTVKAKNGIVTISSTSVYDKAFSIKSRIGDTTTILSDFTGNQSSNDDFTLIQGDNITFTNNTTYRTLTIAGTPNTTYKLYINTAANTTNATTLLNGTSTTTGYIVTNSAYNASSNKIATMTDVTNATASMFQFQNSISELPTGTVKVGYSYRVSEAFTLAAANSVSGVAETLEPGDLLVCTDATTPKYLVLNTNWSISVPSTNTLSTSATTLATVGGQDIKATLPTGGKDTFGVVKTSSTVTSTSGLTAAPIINGIVYYKDTTYSHYNLAFKQGDTVVDTYKPSTSPSKTLLAGANITLSAASNVITIAATDTTYDIATNSVAGLVKVGDTLTDVTGYIAVKIKDGVIYYHDTTYSFSNLQFQQTSGTNLMTYNSQATRTILAGSNITFSHASNVLTIAAKDEMVKFSATAASTDYYLAFKAANTTTTSQQLYYNSGVKVNGTTITATLSGNASTASNLNKTNVRGYLYQSADPTTSATGVGSVNAEAKIGIPYIGYSGSANTYGLYEDLFYLSSTTKYIGDDVKSIKFTNVKTHNSTTDDWNGSTTSGTSIGGATTYTAGTGINISNDGVISTTTKEWFGTEAQFNAIPSLDSNTIYYITE